MRKRPNSSDVARRVGVSRATVSAVLNGGAGSFVSEGTRERVLAAAREMGYRPNRAARSLVTGRTHLVTAMMNGVRSSYYRDVIEHMRRRVQDEGFELLISPGHENGEPDNIALSEWPCDGILGVDPFSVRSELLLGSLFQQTPFVALGSSIPETTDYVGIDLYSGTVEAVQHLLSVGCRRVAYVVHRHGNHVGDARFDAYTAVMHEAGLSPEYTFHERDGRGYVRESLRDYIERAGLPDGAFCFNDDTAIAAYRALRDLGLRIPDDVALVGCDGIEDMEYFDPPLSTIVAPVAEMCARAWQFLQGRMEHRGAPLQQIMLQSHLVIRDSSRR